MVGSDGSSGDGFALAKEIYAYALAHVDELCAPYASVIDINRAIGGCDMHPSTRRHRVTRIDGQVHDRGLHLGGIRDHRPHV